MSERRASRVLGMNRSSLRYRSCRGDDRSLRERLRSRLAGLRDGGSGTEGCTSYCAGRARS